MLPDDIKQLHIRDLESEYKLVSKKLHQLRKARITGYDPSMQFKVDQDIEQAEQEQKTIERELNQYYAQLVQDEVKKSGVQEGIEVKEQDFLAIPEALWELYEKVEFIGRGGLSNVYKVRNPRVHTISALKILLPKHHHDSQMIARFWAEGRILGLLRSTGGQHIVNVRNMGKSADHEFFIEMDYVPGKTLDVMLQEEGRFPPHAVLRLLRQLAAALRHAHAYHVIHRDVKPQNIIVDNGRLTLMDFGIAKRLDSDSVMTTDGRFLGTPVYAAPEQFDPKAFGAVSATTDIYALGILGYQLLTNALPFTGMHTAVMYGHCHEPLPPFPDDVHVPAELASIIFTCAQKQPKNRFTTMQEVETAIDEIVHREAVAQYQEIFAPYAQQPNLSARQQAVLEDHRKLLELSREEAERIEQEVRTAEEQRQEQMRRVQEVRSQAESQNKQEYKAGDELTDPFTGIEFVYIPPGTFMMGATKADKKFLGKSLDSELPRHAVRITQGFWLGKYPVTQAQWLKVMGANPSYFNERKVGKAWGKHPVEQVSWEDVQAFLKKVNEHVETGRRPVSTLPFRLSTEAEWEYACRAGTETMFYFGNDVARLKEYAWYDKNSNSQTHPVGQLQPNAWGIYDMLGNAWEWCQDAWHDNYAGAPADGKIWEEKGDTDLRLLRGGAWHNDPANLRCGVRNRNRRDNRNNNRGVRLVRVGGGQSLPSRLECRRVHGSPANCHGRYIVSVPGRSACQIAPKEGKREQLW